MSDKITETHLNVSLIHVEGILIFNQKTGRFIGVDFILFTRCCPTFIRRLNCGLDEIAINLIKCEINPPVFYSYAHVLCSFMHITREALQYCEIIGFELYVD